MLSVYGGGLSTVATARHSFAYMSCRWATNLGGGNTQNGRDSQAKRLGIKLGNGATVLKNQIIVRQRGLQYWPGRNIEVGKDHSLNARCDGTVNFSKDYDSKRTYVNVFPRDRNALPNSAPGAFKLVNITRAVHYKPAFSHAHDQ